jgi:hypothetical protein
MPDPTGYTEWGYLGGLIFIVVAFLIFLWRMNSVQSKRDEARDAEQAKRDQEWRDFFTALSGGNERDITDMRTTANRLMALLEDLLKSYNAHDTQAKNIAAAISEIRVELSRLSPGLKRRD